MDELKPMEQQNEPSTAEIVKALRNNVSEFYPATSGLAADRLEQLERENAEKDARIADLTARAEKAEANRDAAIADIEISASDGACRVCLFGKEEHISEECLKEHCFVWRGLSGKGNDGKD